MIIEIPVLQMARNTCAFRIPANAFDLELDTQYPNIIGFMMEVETNVLQS